MSGKKDKGTIFNIQKFSIHDGEGIRTLIFMKGCPLKCIWCSNPESQKSSIEIMDVKSNCIACGKCVNLCISKAINPVTFDINRNLCDECGVCAKYCYANAKKLTGKKVTISELITVIEKDRIFYTNSGGGVTIGGGEPVMQYEFVTELLKACKEANIHTAVETCGYGKWRNIGEMFNYLDEVFFDLKMMDSNRHKKLTGVGNELILQNAKHIAEKGVKITFRIPLIPSVNDDTENIRYTGEFVSELSSKNDNIAVEILPYHELGKDKYQWLNMKYEIDNTVKPDKVSVEECKTLLKELGCRVI